MMLAAERLIHLSPHLVEIRVGEILFKHSLPRVKKMVEVYVRNADLGDLLLVHSALDGPPEKPRLYREVVEFIRREILRLLKIAIHKDLPVYFFVLKKCFKIN
jgi:hypothetical protein